MSVATPTRSAPRTGPLYLRWDMRRPPPGPARPGRGGPQFERSRATLHTPGELGAFTGQGNRRGPPRTAAATPAAPLVVHALYEELEDVLVHHPHSSRAPWDPARRSRRTCATRVWRSSRSRSSSATVSATGGGAAPGALPGPVGRHRPRHRLKGTGRSPSAALARLLRRRPTLCPVAGTAPGRSGTPDPVLRRDTVGGGVVQPLGTLLLADVAEHGSSLGQRRGLRRSWQPRRVPRPPGRRRHRARRASSSSTGWVTAGVAPCVDACSVALSRASWN